MKASGKRLVCMLPVLCLFLLSCTKEYTLTIKSDPENVKVTDLSRGELGHTDMEIKVRGRGSDYPNVNLTFSKEGYVEKKVDLLRIDHDQIVMETLHSSPTYLYVESIPSSAIIKIFNKEGNQINFNDDSKISRKDFFANRRYAISDNLEKVSLQLNHLGYKPLTKEITIEAHKENRFSFQLEKVKATLSVNSTPNGAEVHERTLGFLGRTPLKLNLTWNQLVRLSQQYDAMDTKSVNFQLTLKKQGYQNKELIQEFQIYTHNPVLWITLEK